MFTNMMKVAQLLNNLYDLFELRERGVKIRKIEFNESTEEYDIYVNDKYNILPMSYDQTPTFDKGLQKSIIKDNGLKFILEG